MTLRDDLLPTVETVRQIPADLGFRSIRVWVRSQTRTAAFGLAGTVTNTDTEITPRPRVARDPELEGFYGAALGPLADGRSMRRVFRVGPITPDHAAGGRSIAELLGVTATDSARPLLMLADDDATGELGTTPVPFKIELILPSGAGRSFRHELLVVEADRIE